MVASLPSLNVVPQVLSLWNTASIELARFGGLRHGCEGPPTVGLPVGIDVFWQYAEKMAPTSLREASNKTATTTTTTTTVPPQFARTGC